MGDVQGYNKKYKSTTLRMWKNERDEAELLYDGGSIRVTLNGRNKAALIDSTTQIISGVYGESNIVNGIVSIKCEQGQSFITTSNISALISSEISAVSVLLNIPSPSIVVRTALTGSIADFLISPYAESSEVVTPETADLFDSQKIDGYKAGDVVSYINVLSPTPQFQTLQLYIAEADIPYEEEGGVPSPEEVDFWLFRGQEMVEGDNSTAIGQVLTVADLMTLSNINPGDTVDVSGECKKYRFNSTSETGIKPLSGEAGSWHPFTFIQPNLLLAAVLTKGNDGGGVVMITGSKVLVHEINPDTQSLSFTVYDSSYNEANFITVTEPSIITKVGAGYASGDFSIVPLGGSTTIITPDDKDPFDPLHPELEGLPGFAYLAGEIVSYQNVLSSDPQFQVKALYIANENIPIVDGLALNPEEIPLWLWQGTEIDVPSNSGATVFVPSIAALRQITGYKIGDTVSVVQGFTYKYMNVGAFQNGVDQYPFDQTVQDGNCWTYRWSFNDLSLPNKISYSNLKYIIDGDDYDGASVMLDYQEGLILLNASSSVTINGQEFVNQPNCIIYRNSQGVLVQEALGGGETLISKTYSELAALVASNELVAGQQYLLTDYRTKHVIPNSSPVEINTGNLEPLILTAVNANSFHVEVKSTIFPSDIIHYRFDDDSCEDGTRDSVNKKWVGGTARTGYIQRRKSTTNNLDAPVDWRNYKVRRWKVDAVIWSNMPYNKNYIAKGSDGNIYKCIKTTNATGVDPSLDRNNWQMLLDTSYQDDFSIFYSYTPIPSDFNVCAINSSNLIINNNTIGVDYDDYYMFCIITEPNNSSGIILENINGSTIGNGFRNFYIGDFDYEYEDYNWYGNLFNNIFFLIPDGSREYYNESNVLGKNCNLNTFIKNTYSCMFSDEFYGNICFRIESCKIGISSFGNIISDNLYGTEISAINRTLIGNNCQSNIFGVINDSNIGSSLIFNTLNNCYINDVIIYDALRYCSGDSIDITEKIFSNQLLYSLTYKLLIMGALGVRLAYYDNNDQLVITDVTA